MAKWARTTKDHLGLVFIFADPVKYHGTSSLAARCGKEGSRAESAKAFRPETAGVTATGHRCGRNQKGSMAGGNCHSGSGLLKRCIDPSESYVKLTVDSI